MENVTTNTMDDTILVSISKTLLDTLYSGQVAINTKTFDVDLLGLCEDKDLFIRRDGRNVISVIDVLKGEALKVAGLDNAIYKDVAYGYVAPKELFVDYCEGDKHILKTIAFEWRGKYYFISCCSEQQFKNDEGEIETLFAPNSYWTNLCYCSECGCYMENQNFNCERDMCIFCERHHVIENYSESHRHNDNPIYFGNLNKDGSFSGLGFELEVDCDHRRNDNNDIAYNLCDTCGLDIDSVRFARDGSLNYGFEVISQPHTIKAFWDKSKEWERMLNYLSRNGYTSHDAGTCGLHIHVSRTMFGKTRAEQDRAIAKIFSFYSDNWNDLAKASRRRDFGYCERNDANYFVRNSKYLTWKKSSKYCTGHYVALNNGNRNTFEFRLGRGTLNAWSFFSWIDLTLTIAKNARRITIDKIESNDILSWLGGIKESTAKYLYRKGAFKSAILELFPSIAWEYDDNDNDND